MIRGACQQFRFKMPYNFEELKAIRITFWQENDNGDEDSVKITKEVLPSPDTESGYDWVQYNEKLLWISLDQTETLQFSVDKKAYVQLRASTQDGFVFASHVQAISVYPTKDETIFE